MKLFEDSLVAPTKADAIRLLLTCDPSDYPKLRECAREEAERLKADPGLQDYRSEGYKLLLYRKWVVTAAEVIAWDGKKAPDSSCYELLDVLKDEAVADHLSKSPPPWLESVLSVDRRDHPHEYHLVVAAMHPHVVRSNISVPKAGHDYYRFILAICNRLPAFSEESVLAHLRRFPIFASEILPRALRMLAEKDGAGYLYEQGIEWWEDGRKLAEGEERTHRARSCLSGKYVPTPLARALGELAKQGEIDRLPLLRTCLEAIGDASREIETRELRRCHDFLAGDTSELLGLFDAYLSLLSSPFPSVVKFAVDHLHSLLGEFTLEQVSELLSEIPPALTHTKSKPLILETVRLVRKLVGLHPSTYAAAVEQIAQALSIPALDIQKEVLAILEMGTKDEQAEAKPSLAPFRTNITGSLKKSFEHWFAEVAEAKSSQAAPPVTQHPAVMPLGEPIAPVESVDDMVFTANPLLSRSPDPMLLEQLMAGLAKLPAESRVSLTKKLTTLHKRALKKIDPKDSWDVPCWIERLGAELIVRLGPEPDAGRRRWITNSPEAPGAIRFLILRLMEILDPTRPPRTLIGTPETALGFIRIEALFARTTENLRSSGSVDHCDFIQGIARVYPGVQHTTTAKPTDPEPLRVLHFLASGEIVGKVETGVWWITAARIRDPKKDYSSEAAFSPFAAEGRPDWLQPARHRKVERGESSFFRWEDDLRDDRQNSSGTIPNDALLSLRFGRISMFGDDIINCDADIRWLFGAAPSHLESILRQALVVTQAASGHTPAPLKTAIPVIFGELSRRRPPLGEAMRLHLIHNLSSSLTPCREATPELWLQAEEHGLLEPVIPEMAEDFRRAIHSFDWNDDPHYFMMAVFDLMRVNPGLHAIKDLHPNLPIRLRDILLGAFSHRLESSPRSLGKTLELLLSLVIDYPAEHAPDLSALAASPLGSKELGIVKKIIKALGR